MLATQLYGFYDSERVADPTASQAISALNISSKQKLNPEKAKLYEVEAKKINSTPAKCDFATKLAPPNYYPRYMVQHGMAAFQKHEPGYDGLKKNFDGKETWAKILKTNHCSP